MTTSTQNNRPVAELRDGLLKIAIFQNERQDGNGFRYSGKLVRSYQDAEGNWRETQSLSSGDYLRGANLLVQAYNRVLQLKAEAKQAADSGAQQ